MFDEFVVVDWSANSTPKRGRDSIWIALFDGHRTTVENHSTRAEAERRLGDIVDRSRDRRTLIGVDFSLGYPTGTASALGVGADPWCSTSSMITEMVVDDERNANNRFEVAAALNERMTGEAAPFWGCPPARVSSTLRSTKPPSFGPFGEWRLVEQRLRRGGLRPFSSWQLLGAGAVGSQTLLGLPMVHRTLRREPGRVHVWPFTTGLRAPEADVGTVVIAELWPSMMSPMAAEATNAARVRDEAQVRAAAAWLASVDADGTIGELFAPDMTAAERAAVEREEGWVLGVAG
jgi:precorrin-8X/cobalt-precorrin-8 methylmutase